MMSSWFFPVLLASILFAALWPWMMAPPRFPTPIPGATYTTKPMIGSALKNPTPFGSDIPSKTPRNPFMAPNGLSTIHADGASSDVHKTGPTGRNLQITSRVGSKYPGGMCATATFSKEGNIIVLCASLAGFQLHLLAPRTLELLAVYDLPQRPSTFAAIITLNPERIMLDTSGGAYYYLDHNDCAVLGDADNHIQRVGHRKRASDGKWEFYQVESHDMRPYVPHDCFNWNNLFPTGGCDPITAVTPDYEGNIWWVTRQGIVGVVVIPKEGSSKASTEPSEVYTVNLQEEMQNGITVGPDGVYLVTTHALYCMELRGTKRGAKTIEPLWREEYDRGTFQKVGMLSVGSGTAPTLFGGDIATINDNNDERVNLVLYQRDVSGTKKVQKVQKGQKRTMCVHPLFDANLSASDNSMVAIDNSIFMENNFGYKNAIQQSSWDRATIPGGIERIDIDRATNTCKRVWRSDERAPSCVAKLGQETGLIYYYTYEEEADSSSTIQWYLTAIRATDGKTQFKVPTGTGRNYDNNWGPVTLGPDGTAYIGVLQGIIAIWDE